MADFTQTGAQIKADIYPKVATLVDGTPYKLRLANIKARCYWAGSDGKEVQGKGMIKLTQSRFDALTQDQQDVLIGIFGDEITGA